jgi:hypothetical protein
MLLPSSKQSVPKHAFGTRIWLHVRGLKRSLIDAREIKSHSRHNQRLHLAQYLPLGIS